MTFQNMTSGTLCLVDLKSSLEKSIFNYLGQRETVSLKFRKELKCIDKDIF